MGLTEFEKAEMRMDYNSARDKKKQIEILTQLYDCSKETVLNALDLDIEPFGSGSEKPTKKPVKKRVAQSYDSAVKKDVLQMVMVDGEPISDVAERLGLTYKTLWQWVNVAKKKQNDFANYAKQVEKEMVCSNNKPQKLGVKNPVNEGCITSDGLYKHAFAMRKAVEYFSKYFYLIGEEESADILKICDKAEDFAAGINFGREHIIFQAQEGINSISMK